LLRRSRDPDDAELPELPEVPLLPLPPEDPVPLRGGSTAGPAGESAVAPAEETVTVATTAPTTVPPLDGG
jgi:hypothetical protein